MYKKVIIGDLIVYQFPENTNSIGTNISFIDNNNTQIIIDAGYIHLTKEILGEIKNNPICICTHYHPDHYDGFRLFTKTLIANSNYLKTLENFEPVSKEITPDILIDLKQKMNIEGKDYTFVPNKGHSLDGLLIIVDNLIFVGDELMYTNQGLPILPYVSSNIQDHIDSLKIIKKLSGHKLVIPAHGKIVEDRRFLMEDINKRIEYLTNLKSKKVDISDQKYKYFLNLKWHESNLKAR